MPNALANAAQKHLPCVQPTKDIPMKNTSLRTRAIHAGETVHAPGGPVSPPLHMANSYMTEANLSFSAEDLTPDSPFIYTRWSNPTIAMLERRVASLEDAEEGLCFSSGMAAITGLFTHFLGAGDHLVMSNVAYAGAVEYTYDLLPQMGVYRDTCGHVLPARRAPRVAAQYQTGPHRNSLQPHFATYRHRGNSASGP